jgi:hypothetical protein
VLWCCMNLAFHSSRPSPLAACMLCDKNTFFGSVFPSFFPLTPLESALPQNVPVTCLESALPNLKDLKSPRIILLQKRWGGGGKLLTRNLTMAVRRARRAFAPTTSSPSGKGGLYGNLLRRCPMLSIGKAGVAEGASLLDRSFSKAR